MSPRKSDDTPPDGFEADAPPDGFEADTGGTAPAQDSRMDKIIQASRALGRAAGSTAVPGGLGEVAGFVAGSNPEALANAAPALGATAGGMLAAPLGLAPAGAGVGGMAGEVLKQADLALMGKGQPKPLPERIIEAGKSGALGVVGEAALPAVRLAGKGVKAVGRGLAKGSELLTGTEAGVFRRVADDPSLILPEWMGGPKSLQKASGEYGAAAKKAGFTNQVTGKTPALADFAGTPSPFKETGTIADKAFNKIAAGEQLNPQETFQAYRDATDRINIMGRKNQNYITAVKFKDALQQRLLEIDPGFIKQIEDYAASATGARATNLLPRTATGKVSQGRLGFNSLITGGGALAGGVPGFLATMAASSPATHGLASAGLGTVAKIASSPAMERFSLQELLQRLKRGQE